MKYLKLFEQHNTDDIEQYIGYFKDENIEIKDVKVGGKGEYSQTYIINNLYALNIRTECNSTSLYEELIDEDYDYLPTVYDVRIADDDMTCIVMELLEPISQKQKDIIDTVDFLFYMFDEDGLDVFLERNIQNDLIYEIETRLRKATIKRIKSVSTPTTEAKYLMFIKDLKENINTYKSFLRTVQACLREYMYTFNFPYTDFHGDNIMKDKYGNFKLIDL
jgi:hypothetical protein